MPIVLKYLLLLRGLVVIGQIAALLIIDSMFGIEVPWVAVGLVFSGLLALTLQSWRRLRDRTVISSGEFVAQLLADVMRVNTSLTGVAVMTSTPKIKRIKRTG